MVLSFGAGTLTEVLRDGYANAVCRPLHGTGSTFGAFIGTVSRTNDETNSIRRQQNVAVEEQLSYEQT
jgi:hypothetical protein